MSIDDFSIVDVGTKPADEKHLATVIFVHGFRSDETSAWTYDPSDGTTFWPSWIQLIYPGIRVLNVSYPTAPGRSGDSVYDHAKTVRGILDSDGATSKKPVVFVCHSMGGLIVKQLIATNELSEEFQANLTGVAFFGTPHKGSAIASGAMRLLTSAVLRPEILDMHRNSSYLHFLHQVYMEKKNRHKKEKNQPQQKEDQTTQTWQHIAFCEKRGLFGVKVVPLESARLVPDGEDGAFKDVELPRNHAGICKFESAEDVGFKNFINFLERVLGHKDVLGDAVTQNKTNATVGRTDSKASNVQPWERFVASLGGMLAASTFLFIVFQGEWQDFTNQLKTKSVDVMISVTVMGALSALISLVLARRRSPLTNFAIGIGVVLFFRFAGDLWNLRDTISW
ncbi:esterase/lipase family protein [Tateyamaria sp. SN3-11]|uniref:esterase/lipase family protein n=1 Tax=Tateyamaria sp. SN3-11 TaxID=3092147 RepID=UPI0039E9E846